MMGITLNLHSDDHHKQGGFSKTLPEKSLKFVLNREGSIVTFNISLILLPVKIDSVADEQSRKRDAFRPCGIGHIKIILVLLAEVVLFYM